MCLRAQEVPFGNSWIRHCYTYIVFQNFSPIYQYKTQSIATHFLVQVLIHQFVWVESLPTNAPVVSDVPTVPPSERWSLMQLQGMRHLLQTLVPQEMRGDIWPSQVSYVATTMSAYRDQQLNLSFGDPNLIPRLFKSLGSYMTQVPQCVQFL